MLPGWEAANIKETRVGFEFENLGKDDLLALRQAAVRLLSGEPNFIHGRFKAEPIFNTLRIMDLEAPERNISFMDLKTNELEGLRDLTGDTLETMLS
jgi:hypothetical protein